MESIHHKSDLPKIKQKGILSVEMHYNESSKYIKSEHVIISRNEYNSITKQLMACQIVYTNNIKPYLVPIKVPGMRRNSKVDTLNIYTLKQDEADESSYDLIGEMSYMEFLKIAQAISLNFNFPL